MHGLCFIVVLFVLVLHLVDGFMPVAPNGFPLVRFKAKEGMKLKSDGRTSSSQVVFEVAKLFRPGDGQAQNAHLHEAGATRPLSDPLMWYEPPLTLFLLQTR
jgi:hypothetical protein